MKYTVYGIYDTATWQLVYVGCTKSNPKIRFSVHLSSARQRLTLWLQKPRAMKRMEKYQLGQDGLTPSEHKTMILCRYLAGIQDLTVQVIAQYDTPEKASELEHAMICAASPLCNTQTTSKYKTNYAA